MKKSTRSAQSLVRTERPDVIVGSACITYNLSIYERRVGSIFSWDIQEGRLTAAFLSEIGYLHIGRACITLALQTKPYVVNSIHTCQPYRHHGNLETRIFRLPTFSFKVLIGFLNPHVGREVYEYLVSRCPRNH